MNWFTVTVTYLTLWWIVLFCVLPFGARSQSDAGEVVEGTEPGAPVTPNIKKKLILTSGITLIVWSILALLLTSGWISLSNPLGKFGPS